MSDVEGSNGQHAPGGPGNEPRWLMTPKTRSTGSRPELPESTGYRLKRRLLGPPLVSDELQGERLGKGVALAVLSSDVMSSCAYGTESILRILVPAVGVAAFSLVTPATGLLLLVLGVVCLCYRQVVKTYPVSGGSYVVSRENFGYSVAQIPGAALLLSYVLTVAVSVAAGVDAVISAFPVLSPYPVELAVFCVLVLTFGNLRGIREAGKVFAVPTYWFFASMAALIIAGVVRFALHGHLQQAGLGIHGQVATGRAGGGLLLGASLFIFLRAFANGGSAMTGMEAISNAVTVFKTPQEKNARTTLVLMASILGVMFLAVSIFAALTHAVPFVSGTPTVLSQIGRTLFGASGIGQVGYYSLQFGTALILILGANTSYNGFPHLVSFIAEDAYLPRPFTTRGHRLVYSNGIFALTAVSIGILVVTRARVADLIPLYACTVFTGFTMAGAGMTKYHLNHKTHPHAKRNIAINATAFAASAIVTLIFIVTEFTRGAWLVVVVIPLIVFVLTRTHRRYQEEKEVLEEEEAPGAVAEPARIRNHVVLVLIDSLDLASARAVQLARSLALSGEVRAVHFVIDTAHAKDIERQWTQFGLSSIPLELFDCPDRRLARAATELVDELVADGETEVVVVLPRRIYRGVANRILHSHTADRIVTALSAVPHVSATVAPFDVGGLLGKRRHKAVPDWSEPDSAERFWQTGSPKPQRRKVQVPRPAPVAGATPIADLAYRQRMRFAGRVRSVRVQPLSGVPTLVCTIVDDTGAVNLVFLGRRSIPGIEPGTRLSAEGMVGRHNGQRAVINPTYQLLTPSREHGAGDSALSGSA
jgi:amino acid transporter